MAGDGHTNLGAHCAPLPRLAEWSDLDIERPRGTGLFCYMPGVIGNCHGRDKKIVGLVLEALAGPRHVNHAIDDDVGNMHTLRSQIPSHRFGEDTLGRFCRCEARKIRPAALRRQPSAKFHDLRMREMVRGFDVGGPRMRSISVYTSPPRVLFAVVDLHLFPKNSPKMKNSKLRHH